MRASLVAQTIKRLPTMRETWGWSLGREDPREKEMAPHSSTLAWRISWTEKPGRLQSMGSQRVGHDWSALAVASEPFNFSFFSITAWGIDLNYHDIEWFTLETNRDHSLLSTEKKLIHLNVLSNFDFQVNWNLSDFDYILPTLSIYTWKVRMDLVY